MLDRPPRRLQQEPMLRVHQSRLADRETEKRCVKTGYVIDEACSTGDDLPWRVGIRVEEFVDVPPVGGQLRYGVAAFSQHLPKLLGVSGARQTRGIADDRDPGNWHHLTCARSHAVAI